MSKHTPGPWKIFDGWGSSKRNPVIVDSIPDVNGQCVANCICHVSSTNDDAEANARLIAAAPDLLEIVRRLAEWAESDLMGDFDQIASDAVVLWAKLKWGEE